MKDLKMFDVVFIATVICWVLDVWGFIEIGTLKLLTPLLMMFVIELIVTIISLVISVIKGGM